MRILWREAGIAALVCGALTACASPAYPINDDQRPGPAPLTMARPAYPISEQAQPAEAPRAMAPRGATTPPADGEPAAAPLSAPIAPVDSQPLPAPGPSSSAFDSRRSDGASRPSEYGSDAGRGSHDRRIPPEDVAAAR